MSVELLNIDPQNEQSQDGVRENRILLQHRKLNQLCPLELESNSNYLPRQSSTQGSMYLYISCTLRQHQI